MKKIIVSILTIGCLLSVAPLSLSGKGAFNTEQSNVNESVVHFFDGNFEYVNSVAGSSIHLRNTTSCGYGEDLKPGWPIQLDNHHGSAWAFDSSVTVADLDQDGDFEVLIHSGEGITNGKLYVFHHNGSSMNGWPIYTGSQGISTPAVGDIDPAYSGLEVVVSMNSLGSFMWNMYAWHSDGTPVDGWPVTAGQSFCSPSLADIDNDGFLEIIQFIDNLGGEEWRNGKLYVWNGNGTNVSGFPITFESSSYTRGTSTAVGDIDNDGNLEIVFGLFNKQMYIFRNNGALFPGWPITLESSEGIESSPVLGDVDNDGDLEIVCASVGDIDNIHVFHHNGSYMQGWPKTVDWISDQSPSLCNIDNDSDLEIVLNYGIGSSTHDKIVIWHHNGSLLDGWPQNDSHPIRGQSTIGDIDGDQDFEIFSPGSNFFAWHHDGELLENFPKMDVGRIDGAAAIADLENNGKMDLIAGIYAWEFTDDYETLNIEWPMFQHDAQHTGLYVKANSNSPPNAPFITGPASGKTGVLYNYNFSTTDIDGDNVYYYIDWGDDSNSGWLGPYVSGAQASATHSWSQKGTYTIKAKAKDIYGTESNWTTLPVTMPLDLQISQSQSLISLLRFALVNKISILTVFLQNIQTTTSSYVEPKSSDVSSIVESDSNDISTTTQVTDTQTTSDTKSTVIVSDKSDDNDVTKSTDTGLSTEKSSSDQNAGNSKELIIAK